MTTSRSSLLSLALSLAAVPAFAHEGHEHSADEREEAPAAQPLAQSDAGAPRLAISQPPVELVVVQGRDGLLIYADDYASNAPLAGLRVQLQVGSRLLDASEVGPGSYRVARDLIGDGGGTVTFSLHGVGHDAELSGELPPAPAEFAEAETRVSSPPRLDHWTMLFGLVLAAISLAGGWNLKRRR